MRCATASSSRDGAATARLTSRSGHDADPAERDGPRQRHAEARAGHGGGDDVPDVEEAADRGQDAERDAEKLLHPPCALTKRLSSRADLASFGSCLATSLKSARRAAMRAWLSASAARVNRGSRSSRRLSDLWFGGCTLSKVVCAPDAVFSASLT